MKTIILSRSDLRAVIHTVGLDALMDALILRLKEAIQAFDEDVTHIPPRSGFSYSHPYPGLIEWMPLLQYGTQVVNKVVGYHPQNPAMHDLPTIVSTVSAYDTSTGHLIGLIDGTFLTALRTGAASAVASQSLARPESKTLGLIGSGAQAVTQVHALSRIFPLERVLFHDSNPSVAASFPDRMTALGLTHTLFEATPVRKIVETSDILCTATSVDVGAGPVFRDGPTQPWLHINAVGSDFPGKVELPASLLRRSLVCPDFLDQAIHEGECQQLRPDEIGPDLVELIQNPEAHAEARDHLTVFDSTGWALEDAVTMDLLLYHASELDLGTPLEIECLSGDAQNPYGFVATDTTEPELTALF